MNDFTWIGLTAGALTTLAFVPQVVRTWRMKTARDLSLGTFGMLAAGVSLWLVYGLLLDDVPIILTNLVTLLLVMSVLVLALWYRRLENRAETRRS